VQRGSAVGHSGRVNLLGAMPPTSHTRNLEIALERRGIEARGAPEFFRALSRPQPPASRKISTMSSREALDDRVIHDVSASGSAFR